MRLLCTIGLTVLVLAGCASTRPKAPQLDTTLPEAFPYHTLEQIEQQLILTSDTLHAFTGKANLSIQSPSRSGRFSADLRARRGDSLFLSISPGLGIEAARALVTPDSVFLYDRLQNQVTYGSLDEAAGLLALPIEGDDVFRNLLGLVVPDPAVDWRLEADTAFYYLRDPTGTRTYTADPSIWRIVRYEQRTPAGELVEERVFSDFDRFEGVYLPRRVLFRRPPEKSTASLYYRSLELNPEALSFALRTSGSTRRVPVGGK